jgi:transcriptional regulator with XRE-family HTH domain
MTMNKSWTERQTHSLEARRLYEQERLTVWATELVSEAMNEGDISKADLARLLGTSRAHVTNLLSGQRNMTLRTLADVACVLGQRVSVALEPMRWTAEYVSTAARIHRPQRPHFSVVEGDSGTVVENPRIEEFSTAAAQLEDFAA